MSVRVKMFLIIVCIALFPSSATQAQSRRALLIGISDYGKFKCENDENKWSNIHGVNDVELLSPTLKNMGFKTTIITNNSATAKRIRKELKSLVKSCRKGDKVYIHFSCHGQPFEDLSGDEDDGWDESIVPYDAQKQYSKGVYEGQNHIIDDELHECFDQIRFAIGPKGFLCVVIDACHSGGSSRGDELDDDEEQICRGTKQAFSPSGRSFRPRINANGRFQITKTASMGDILILEACRSYQSNYEIKQDGIFYGPLSYYVNQSLLLNQFPHNLDLVKGVKKRMDGDRRLSRQNMVYETSIKNE